MEKEINKLKAYIGFAIKSSNIIFGFDKLCETKKNYKLIIICSTVNDKVLEKLIKLGEYKKCKVIKLNEGVSLGDLVGRLNCKVIGILDINLIKGILEQARIFTIR